MHFLEIQHKNVKINDLQKIFFKYNSAGKKNPGRPQMR
jgi:hypothetical protein